MTPDGRVKIEAKEKMKGRLGGDSPDRADALSMTFMPELRQGGAGIALGR